MDGNELTDYYSNISNNQRDYFADFSAKYPLKTLLINNFNWNYYSGGTGDRTMILFHGGYLDAGMYIHQLMDFGKEYRVIAPTVPPGVSTLAEIVDATLTILEEEDIEPVNLTILGISFGGICSQVFYQLHPEKVDKAVLSHTLTRDEELKKVYTKNLSRFRLLPWFVLKRLFKKGGMKNTTKWATNSDWKDLIMAYFSSYMEKLSKELIINRTACLVDFWNYEQDDHKGIDHKSKILILASKDDSERVNSEVEKLVNIFPGAGVHWFEKGKGGHHTALYYPEEYNKVVSVFLDG